MKTMAMNTGAVLALLLMAAGPQQVEAQTPVWSPEENVCAGVTFNPCVDFELFDNGGGSYSFVVTYVSVQGTDQTGYITSAGLYDYGSGTDWDFESVKLIVPDTTKVNWTYGDTDGACDQLSGGGSVLFEGCAATGKGGINNGVPLTSAEGGPYYLQFDFTSTTPINSGHFASSVDGSGLGARVHIQGIDEYKDCSFKLDHPQGLVSTDCYGPVVPEPMTVILLATGLVGIGAVGYRNRRKEEEEV